jgi:hypothetical protein
MGPLVRPAIEISRVSANVDHRVDRGTAAERSAARQVDPPLAQTLLRLGREVPIVLGLEQLRFTEGFDTADLNETAKLLSELA